MLLIAIIMVIVVTCSSRSTFALRLAYSDQICFFSLIAFSALYLGSVMIALICEATKGPGVSRDTNRPKALDVASSEAD
eukprot:SAG31_NODE_43205_length_268_cov_0.609467_1_plen_78_part_10